MKKLQEKLDYLISVRRNEISEQIAIARGFGDLSENAEYDEAKKEQIREAINNLGSTADEIIQMLEYYLDKADTSDGYLHLSFF